MIHKEDIAEGLEFENNGQLSDAYLCYLNAANYGNPLAMFMIGNLYLYKKYRGKEALDLKTVMMPWDKQTQTVPDLETAYSWYLRSAQNGYPDAMSNVGTMLYYGQGVEKNLEESKMWLLKAAKAGSEYGVKALKDFFGINKAEDIPDDEYDRMLERFCEAVEESRPDAGDLYRKLLLGNDRQLCRLGYRIAVGRYHISDAYREIAYPNKTNGRSCAPVSRIRIGWATLLIVNRSAFPESEPIVSFSHEGGAPRIFPLSNAVVSSEISYERNEKWGWFPEKAKASCLKLIDCDKPAEDIDHALSCALVKLDEIAEAFLPNDDESLFFETGEKEYSAEVCYLCDGYAVTMLRYSIDSCDQGDFISEMPKYNICKEGEQ